MLGKNDKALENAALANLEALKTSNIKLIDDSELNLSTVSFI